MWILHTVWSVVCMPPNAQKERHERMASFPSTLANLPTYPGTPLPPSSPAAQPYPSTPLPPPSSPAAAPLTPSQQQPDAWASYVLPQLSPQDQSPQEPQFLPPSQEQADPQMLVDVEPNGDPRSGDQLSSVPTSSNPSASPQGLPQPPFLPEPSAQSFDPAALLLPKQQQPTAQWPPQWPPYAANTQLSYPPQQ